MYLKDFDVKISGSHKIKVSTKAWIIRISMLIIVSFLVAYRLYQGAIFHNPSVIGSTIMPTISILMLIGEDDDIAAAVLSIRQMLALLFFLCLSILYSCKSSVFTASTLKEFIYHTRSVFC
jgi:hypothetical protein